jgi:signal transduction histidine kinase
MRRPIYILYILAVYVLIQFCWWAYLLIELNEEVYTHRIENVQLQAINENESREEISLLEKKISQRRWMVIGEGIVFLSLLIWGTVVTMRSFRKEMLLARQQKNFLLSITHEFKSPLAAIKLYLQTLLKHDLEKEKEVSFINSAISDTERLNNLVENALLANLIDHHGYSFSKEDVNISALARLTVQKFQQMPDHKKIGQHIEEGLHVFADKNALMVMLNNLLENAWKYSPGEKNISLDLSRKGKNVLLSISDQGTGIPDSEKEKIFSKFYRIGNEETRRTKGTGLGLFIVKFIIEKHDGRITVQDNSPRGSVFSVELPLSE